MKFQKGHIPWLKGTKGLVKKNSGSFKKGNIPWNKGKEFPQMLGNTHGFKKGEPPIHKFEKGHTPWNKGVPMDEETKKKISIAHTGRTGVLSGNWKGGIRKKKNERNDSLYQLWVSQVKKRDNNQCVFKSRKCSGYCVAHHILPWRDYPELRYKVKNGITLCQYHHPRKRRDEQRLIPFFQEMVRSKELI